MAYSQSSFKRARGSFGGSQPSYPRSTPNLPPPDSKQQKLEEILIDSLIPKHGTENETKPQIKDAEYLGSYNWVDINAATILVPGTSLPLALRR